ncbi:MAG: TIGR00300 family protein [Actinomycetota bacterium]
MPGSTETVEIRGHIIDSLILPKILDLLIEGGAEYEVLDFQIGRTHKDASYARIRLTTTNPASLNEILNRIHQYGAAPIDTGTVTTETADRDGAFPATFYSTTNLPTELKVDGTWIRVEVPEMDCGIAVEGTRAWTVPVSEVVKGQQIVVGRDGIRVTPVMRPRGHQDFEFMASSVSAEKPKELQVMTVAQQMRAVHKDGGKILWVTGPALIHTGSGPDLAALVHDGWVDVLFAGNGFATHDIESNLYKTSLGLNLEKGTSAEGGHEHHIRSINAVRRSGSIAAAVADGTVTGGVMFELIRKKVPFVLGGSVRDDGPLPDTVTDVIETQQRMREQIAEVGLCIIVATMLHGIATGNILPAAVPIVCVDINPSTVTKLLDRGSIQSAGLVTDVGLFIKQLRNLLT